MIYLRFPDEQTAKECLTAFVKDGEWQQDTKAKQIFLRGTLYNQDGVYGEEEMISAPTEKEGYHVDLLAGNVTQEIQAYIIQPITPEFKMF